MNILLTNDDGFASPFLGVMADALKGSHNIYMAAPSTEQSGVGQAIAIYTSLTCSQVSTLPYPAYQVVGSPSDCVKFAVCHLYKHIQFDLAISGINPGENAGLCALYSGTVAGAREAATWGIPAVSISVWDSAPHRACHAAAWLSKSLAIPGFMSIAPGVFWNINFPRCEPEHIKGTEFCRMSTAMFKDHYVEYTTPRGTAEYWLDGAKPASKFQPGTDDWALSQSQIAISPLFIDQTCGVELQRLKAFAHPDSVKPVSPLN